MAVNSSSSSLNSFPYCSETTAVVIVVITYTVSRFLLVPLSLLVLYIGHQRWRQQRSFATTSHSDIFTYHSSVIELIYTLGAAIFLCGNFTGLTKLTQVGYYLGSVDLPGKAFFHVLTCLDRYLAVVHPVIYLKLRQSGGVRIRNISIGCVWLLCFVWIAVTAVYYPDFTYNLFFIFFVLALVVVSFCSLSVLWVLIGPGPGETAGDRKRIDQLKQRAFNTISAITAVLWSFFLWFIVCLALEKSHVLSDNDGCLVVMSANFISLPSGLVLPLLFLHRAKKLVCFYCSK